MIMSNFDELKAYYGYDIKIAPKILIHQPTLKQVTDFGEEIYFSAIKNFTSVGADLKAQLWILGIDYTQIGDYDLFFKLVSQLVSSKKKLYYKMSKDDPEKFLKLSNEEKEGMLINPMQLILINSETSDGIDLADFDLYENKDTKDIYLYNVEDDIMIDRVVYTMACEAIRNIHGLERNNQIPANEQTKMDLIEDAIDELEMAQMQGSQFKSVIKPLHSSLAVHCGLCGDEGLWNIPIGRAIENLKRITKEKDSDMLLQGVYSGFGSLKGIDKDRLSWTTD